MERAVQSYKQRGMGVQNIDVLRVHGSGSLSAGSVKAVLHNGSNSSHSISTSISSSNQINSRSSASFPAQFVSVVRVDDMKINREPCQQLFVPNKNGEKHSLETQYGRGM